MDRRRFLQVVSGVAAGAVVPATVKWLSVGAVPIAGGTQDPTAIPKYVTPLAIMRPLGRSSRLADGIDYYEIGLRQFRQQMLPVGSPATTVWGYGPAAGPTSAFSVPGPTIENTAGVPTRVKWVNQLTDGVNGARGKYLPSLLPIDPTLHWANPGGPIDSRPTFTTTPGRYLGPVPHVSHVHGAHVTPESDGYPEAWFLPDALDIPAGYSRTGSKFDQYDRTNTTAGSAVFQYSNDQYATSLWYHDHTLGVTRTNVYAGAKALWFIRGGARDLPSGVLPGPAPTSATTAVHEIPMMISDRAFQADGSLFYPDTRAFFDGFTGPYVPDASGVAPIWQPEFFGDTMVVNGNTWPTLTVEPRRYRFRLLNASGSRTLWLKITATNPASPSAFTPGTDPSLTQLPAAMPFVQIGGDGGFLAAPTGPREFLLMAPAERADVIVDFTGLAAGTTLYLTNEGPDSPYGGGQPGVDFPISDEQTTRQVMQFTVGALLGPDTSTPPSQLALPALPALPAPTITRKVSLNEAAYTTYNADGSVNFDGPIMAQLGVVDAAGMGMGMMWADPPTERPALGSTEVWEICNYTMDAHPIHLHQVDFEVVNRQPMGTTTDAAGLTMPICVIPANSVPRPPEPTETGPKDTVIAYPGEITRVKARFDLPGNYVWHCHIVEHEDNEMMRPMTVTSSPSVPVGELLRYSVVALGGGSLAISSSTVSGDVAAGPKSTPRLSAAKIGRSLFFEPAMAITRNAATVITGGAVPRPLTALAAAATSASTAAANAKAIVGTKVVTLPSVTKAVTIAGGGGLTVVATPSIQVSGTTAQITLTGGAGDEFIINVAGGISFANGAGVRLIGVLPSQVTFNMLGTKNELAVTGTTTSIVGTYLNPRGPIRITGATITGSVIGGTEVTVTGGAKIARV